MAKPSNSSEIVTNSEYAEIILLDKLGCENGRTKISLNKVNMVEGKRCWLHKDRVRDYAYIWADGKQQLLHRYITNCPAGFVVDHKDLDGLNNTDNNLLVCTNQKNMHNRKPCSKSRSGITGVEKVGERWRVQIQAYGKRNHIGYFDDLESAREARLEAEKVHWG